MNLTKKTLENYYKQRNSLYLNKSDLSNRFKEITEIVDLFMKLDIDQKYINEFAPFSDDLLGDNGAGNRKTMIENGVDQVEEMWKLIGGFDGASVQAKYRIISSSRGKNENYYENENYSTAGQNLWANSNFVTNNYPHQIAAFLKCCKEDDVNNYENCIDGSKIVLTWKTDTYLEKDDFFSASKKRLKTRFPPKFLWMWANKEKVIHFMSLMAFRNFLNTTYGKEILKGIDQNYTPESITNMKFDEFTKAWQSISDKILEDLEINKISDSDSKILAITDISKLISIIMIEETDIKNIADLLKTGNQAVILWGPPGTGKTYESMEVVKELLKIDEDSRNEDIENKYLFSKQLKFEKNQGYYEIIQFHPNYTYEDFIGGISPKIDGENVSYELRQGVFYKFCKEAEKNQDPTQKYIFIIDEINRAELSAVFGELLFALEYRGKHINLPHFGSFTIPKNVYVIGTMNNVDKSLVTFDLALRRRFGFFKLMPKLDVIVDVLTDKVEFGSLEKYVIKCKKLNKKIISDLGLGEDYQIGQAYFLKIKDFLSDEENVEITSFDLEKLWVYNIEPLLEEYLGMIIEDDGIKAKLDELKKFFVEDE